jgi:hypothetical protein
LLLFLTERLTPITIQKTTLQRVQAQSKCNRNAPHDLLGAGEAENDTAEPLFHPRFDTLE